MFVSTRLVAFMNLIRLIFVYVDVTVRETMKRIKQQEMVTGRLRWYYCWNIEIETLGSRISRKKLPSSRDHL